MSDLDALSEENRMLRAEVVLLRGAMESQDERERQAGERCGVPYLEYGCDWPEAVADVVIVLRKRVERLQRMFEGAHE